jgi:thiol-disulfide isomerase/thioredoxin
VAEATVDPWRDTPARIRAFRRRTGVDIRFLTGSPAQIRRLWHALGVEYHRVPQDDPPDRDWWTHRPERFDVTHSDGVFVIDPRGHWRVAVPGMPMTTGRLPARLASLLNGEGRHNLRHPDTPWNPEAITDDLRALMGLPPIAQGARSNAAPATASPAPAPAGSATALARLRTQAGAVLGGGATAFRTRLHALRGHPVIVNEWASWCPPCQEELPLLAAAARRFDRRVAFVGLDVNDDAGAARRFLGAHPVGYPSYSDPGAKAANALASFVGLPTTVYLDGNGVVISVRTGQYADAGQLERDIRRYALGGG